jgi:DNA-binding IclR family transcriptional regulator
VNDTESSGPVGLPTERRPSGGEHLPAGGHQTINRVTHILEEVVYRPGSTLAEITRAVGVPKNTVYGFIRGLLVANWLIEQDHKLYLGPAFYSLAIGGGHIRAGSVTAADLDGLHQDTGLTAFVGVRSGDHLIYIAEADSDRTSTFAARSDIRRQMLTTAGGKALLSMLPESELESYLRDRPHDEQADIPQFLQACPSIRANAIAVNHSKTRARSGIATVVRGPSGTPVASVTLVGPTPDVAPRLDELAELLKDRVAFWHDRRRTATDPLKRRLL